jgi:hypothetical protein
LLLVLFAQDGLSIWLEPALATHGDGLLPWLTIGVSASGIAPHFLRWCRPQDLRISPPRCTFLNCPFFLSTLWALTKHPNDSTFAFADEFGDLQTKAGEPDHNCFAVVRAIYP